MKRFQLVLSVIAGILVTITILLCSLGEYQWMKVKLRFVANSILHREIERKPTITGKLYLSEDTITNNTVLDDVKLQSNPKFSTMVLLGHGNEFNLGEKITVQIKTYDHYGHPKKIGGDFLRLWMENRTLKATVAGVVYDHDNGTYTGVVRSMWKGVATIHCFIDTTREKLAVYYRILKRNSALWNAFGEFVSGKVVESTKCAVTHVHLKSYCNFTNLNSGFPWYCGVPSNPHLNCSHWMHVWSSSNVNKMSGEQRLL